MSTFAECLSPGRWWLFYKQAETLRVIYNGAEACFDVLTRLATGPTDETVAAYLSERDAIRASVPDWRGDEAYRAARELESLDERYTGKRYSDPEFLADPDEWGHTRAIARDRLAALRRMDPETIAANLGVKLGRDHSAAVEVRTLLPLAAATFVLLERIVASDNVMTFREHPAVSDTERITALLTPEVRALCRRDPVCRQALVGFLVANARDEA